MGDIILFGFSEQFHVKIVIVEKSFYPTRDRGAF